MGRGGVVLGVPSPSVTSVMWHSSRAPEGLCTLASSTPLAPLRLTAKEAGWCTFSPDSWGGTHRQRGGGSPPRPGEGPPNPRRDPQTRGDPVNAGGEGENPVPPQPSDTAAAPNRSRDDLGGGGRIKHPPKKGGNKVPPVLTHPPKKWGETPTNPHPKK